MTLRIRIRPTSPWATPWRSDSIFGALCWRWAELFPESFPSVLEEFHSGAPPFLVSDAWPAGHLPLPAHVAVARTSQSAPVKRKGQLLISEDVFRRVATGSLEEVSDVLVGPFRNSIRVQTAIDRFTGGAAEGQLFETDCQTLGDGIKHLDVYLRTSARQDCLLACWHALSVTGFGRKASSGLGAFHIAGPPEPCPWMDVAPAANAFAALNHFIPAPSDPVTGLWRTHVTFPKFHAHSTAQVFKGAYLMLTPGSVFRTPAAPAAWYGSMIPTPTPEMPRALHYALCFPAPLVWKTEAP